MSDEVTRQAAEASGERNVDRESYDWMVRDRDNWRRHAETAERASAVDAQVIQRATNEVHRRKNTCEQLISERNRVSAERDAALAEVVIVTAERDTAQAEAEGLRADLLAHPPEHAARIAELQATIETLKEDGKNCEAEYVAQRDKIAELEADLAQVRYERDVALAASKERHAASAALWESQQEMQHKAGLDARIIEGLREALERTEKRYIEAKARQVPRALVGLLGVIRREAAAAEKMIL